MILRPLLERQVRRALRSFQVVLLSGPRQSGKTTLAKQIAKRSRGEYFDLEDPGGQRRLSAPMEALERLRGLVVIDEVQHQPELFPLMRVLADRTPLPAHFLLLGSASGTLLNRSSESLAGRVAFVEMGGFSLAEVLGKREQDAEIMRRLWWRGRFPRAFLAANETTCREWQEYFIRSFVERDLPQLGVQTPATMLRRFWMMLAH